MSSRARAHYKGENILGATYKIDKDKDTITVLPQALSIIWGTDSRYWRIPSENGEPVELLQVCWLEVSGSVELSNLEKEKEYKLSFKVTMKPDAFGWENNPVYLMVKPGKSRRYSWKKANLGDLKAGEDFFIPKELRFTVPSDSDGHGDKLLFGMYEIWRGRWKGGLIIHEVVIEPCDKTEG